nr:hypothetical protein [Aeromonas veronii]
MKWIFNPAIRLGNQLSFKYKFLLWSCLMLLPLAYSMTNLLGRLQDDNVQANRELAGVVNLTPRARYRASPAHPSQSGNPSRL